MISDSINNQTNDTNDSINSNYTSITITQEEYDNLTKDEEELINKIKDSTSSVDITNSSYIDNLLQIHNNRDKNNIASINYIQHEDYIDEEKNDISEEIYGK
ncbi:hypothetical protein WA158_003553 [Blastocystis sp. Blastoise]